MATFLLVHGAWHDGSCWEPVIHALEIRGHAAVAPDLPCDDVDATYEDYADVAAAAVTAVDGPVVAVGHSLAGSTIPLVAVRRPVSLLVHLASALPRFGRDDLPLQIEPAVSAGFTADALGRGVWDRDRAIEVMYDGLPHDVAVAAADTLRPQAWTPERVPYPLDRHPDGPAASVLYTGDVVVRPAYSRVAARKLLGIDAIELPGGHFPMLEDPSGLAELLVRLLVEPA
jgi:pimeloyl-ACP methyl ester carboxylesterase